MAQIIRSPHQPIQELAQPGQNLAAFLESNPNGIPGDKPAYVRAQDGKVLTRSQLFDASHKTAWSMRNILKAEPGERVAIFSSNTTWYPVAVHAHLLAGLGSVTLNPIYSVDELVHPLTDCKPAYIVAAPNTLPVVREALQKAGLPAKNPKSGKKTLWILSDDDQLQTGDDGETDYRTLVDGANGQRLEAMPIPDPAGHESFIGYSSGTSGKPKGVQLTHANQINLSLQMPAARFGELDPEDRTLGVLPFQHVFALFHNVLFDLYWGVTVYVMPRFELEPFLSYVEKYQITRLEIVPPILVLLAKSPVVDKYNLKSLKVMLSGAAPLSAELGDQVEARLNGRLGGQVRVCQGYGLSETAPSVHACKSTAYHEFKGSIGTLFSNVEARLVDEDGKDVGCEQGKDGKPGELWVRGPTIMKGYLNREDATAEAIDSEGWFKTGDVAICPETDVSHPSLRGRGHGEHFWIVDRKKELIKYKGFQVAPAEMEALLLQHPRVGDAACIGVYDEAEATENVMAFIVPSADWSGSQGELAKEVRAWVDRQVANHKKLRGGVRVRAEIPKSPSGKILRRLLRDEVAAEIQDKAQAAKSKL